MGEGGCRILPSRTRFGDGIVRGLLGVRVRVGISVSVSVRVSVRFRVAGKGGGGVTG